MPFLVVPPEGVQKRLHLSQGLSQMLRGLESHSSHFAQHSMHSCLHHIAQQAGLRLMPHVRQRGQPQPGTNL